jgi:hypothetical protein
MAINLTTKDEIKDFAEKILNGLNYKYIGFSETSFGKSMYFEVDGIKCRFSDHTVQNADRIKNEIFFSINDINSEYNKFRNEQSLLSLRYELGDKSIVYGKRPTLMRSGKTLEAFGFTETKKEYEKGGTIENKFIYTIGGL